MSSSSSAAPSSSSSSSTAASSASSTSCRARVLLLKDRNTKNSPHDAYELACIESQLECEFLPPLRFTYDDTAITRLAESLRLDDSYRRVAAIVATSQRGIDAFCTVVERVHTEFLHDRTELLLVRAAQSSSSPPSAELLADPLSPHLMRWARKPFFVLTSVSATRLNSHPLLAEKYGFHATHFDDVKCAEQLGRKLRMQWKELCQNNTSAAMALETNASEQMQLLVLVGSQRRDELFNTLADESSSDGVVVPVREEIVYHTHQAQLATSQQPNASSSLPGGLDPDATPDFSSRLLALLTPSQHALPSLPTYIAFFSPTGIDTYFTHLEQIQADSCEAIAIITPRYVCIGETTAAAFRSRFTDEANPCPPLLVAAKPNAQALIQAVCGDIEREKKTNEASIERSEASKAK